MKQWLTIDAKRLHEKPFKSEPFSADTVTLFPFFNQAGEAKYVLVVDAATAVLRVIRTENADFSLGFRTITLKYGGIHRLGDHTLGPLGRLWHFDPWWLLKDARFTDRRVIPVLQATNCVERFDREVTSVAYSADLRRVTAVAKGESAEKYAPDMLPASPVR